MRKHGEGMTRERRGSLEKPGLLQRPGWWWSNSGTSAYPLGSVTYFFMPVSLLVKRGQASPLSAL